VNDETEGKAWPVLTYYSIIEL